MITLPVSLGEAIDKHTILSIKLEKISDERKADVKKEYDAIHSLLSEHIEKIKYYYNLLKNTNLIIWNLQDEIRGLEHNDTYVKKCLTILDENDKRFRIKNKINVICNSDLKEQKGYPKKRALFVSHLGMGDMIVMSGAVRYLSLQYDEIIVICKNSYYNNVYDLYMNDPVIKLKKLYSENNSIISEDEHMNIYREYKYYSSLKYDMYFSGMHSRLTNPNMNFNGSYDIHKHFYNNLHMDISIMKDYFTVPDMDLSYLLYNLIEPNMKYAFIHYIASNKSINIHSQYFKDNNILMINPNVNMYNENEEYYTLANNFIDKPLFSYKHIILHAHELHMIDSSFSCLAALLLHNIHNISYINNKRFIYPRDGHSTYNELFDSTWTYIRDINNK